MCLLPNTGLLYQRSTSRICRGNVRQPRQMTSDLDIFRSANLLIKQHGQDAPIHAAMRADAMLDKGDLDGAAAWKRILRAVEELQRVSRASTFK